MATKTASRFRLSYAVDALVPASPAQVWARLTDAAAFPGWNSTVTSIEGTIAQGERLAIRVPISDRVFKPKVVEFETDRRMVWQDGGAPMFRGRRTFTLTPTDDGKTQFSMVEEFTGLMLPMIASSLPDFAPVFDQYAADLVGSFSAG